VQSGGSFDVDYNVAGPNEKIILDGTKERQGDFVFTANDPGEYRFCFNNEMSTFAEKMVDFEIAVSLALLSHLIQCADLPCFPGRKRRPRPAALKAGRQPRTDLRPRRIAPQALRPALDYLPQPEILPHAREP
jgi:hypothetical protein